MDEFLFFIKGFFGAPAILIGLFALLGSILLRDKWTQVLVSTFKAILGFCILSIGGAAIGNALSTFVGAFKALIGSSATAAMGNYIPLAAGILAHSQEIGGNAALMMFCAMVLNVLLAKTSRWKNVFLTGHHLLFVSVCMATMFSFAGIDTQSEKWYYLIVGASILSIYMTLTPSLSKKYMNDLTGEDKMYIAHPNAMLGLSLSAAAGIKISKLINRNKKIKSAENLRFPKWLSFFKNSTASVIITMLVLFSIVYFAAWGKLGTQGFKETLKLDQTSSIPVLIILDSFMFAAGLEALIFGIKMMIGELIPALKGISTRFIRGAKVGVDITVGLSYQPTAVLLGLVSSFIAGLIVFGISIGLNIANPALFGLIVVPGLVGHLFDGGVAATFANVKAGYVAAMIAGFINGIIVSFVPIVFNLMENTILGNTFASAAGGEKFAALQWGEADYFIFAAIGALATTKIGKWFLLGAGLAVYLGLTIDGIIKENWQKKQNPKIFYDFAIENLTTKKNFYDQKFTTQIQELNGSYQNEQTKEKYLKLMAKIEAKQNKFNQNYKNQKGKIKTKYQQ